MQPWIFCFARAFRSDAYNCKVMRPGYFAAKIEIDSHFLQESQHLDNKKAIHDMDSFNS
jgi:hypothetical protein